MKHSILILFSTLMFGCSTDHNVSGDVGVQVEYSTSEIKQVDGILYVRKAIGGITSDCIAIDSSVLYDAEWGDITVQDSNRITAYTQIELDNCL